MATEQKDEFQLDLEKKKEELQKCQTSKELQSCFTCKELLECKIRKDYVYAVYQSMSKGQSGGFEF